jgi:hypothetical protein
LLDATTVCSVARAKPLCWREDQQPLVVKLGVTKIKAAQVRANISLNILSDVEILLKKIQEYALRGLYFMVRCTPEFRHFDGEGRSHSGEIE